MTVNLDPSIIDQDTLRKARRKKMLIYAAAPVIVLLVAGLFFTRPGSITAMTKLGFRSNGAEGVIPIANTQKFMNVIEPYIAYYNTGTTYLASNKLTEAERELRQSLALNPPLSRVCQVRVNLAYTIELFGDKIPAGKTGTYQDKEVDAAYLYSMAQGILYEDNCASQQEDVKPRDENAQNAKKRLEQKIRQADQVSPDGEQGDDGSHKITDQEARAMGDNLRDGYIYRDELRNSMQNAIRRNQRESQSGVYTGPTW